MTINSMHAFLTIDTIKGESRDQLHKDWIEVESLNMDFIQPRSATASSMGGNTAARVEMKTITVVKQIDLASTALFQACANGTTFPKAEVQFMRADKDGNAINYFTINLLNVLVHRISTTIGSNGLPQEVVELSFAAVKQTYTQQNSGGGMGGKTIAQWSGSLNKPTYAV